MFYSLWARILAGWIRVPINNSKHERDESLSDLFFSTNSLSASHLHLSSNTHRETTEDQSSVWKELIRYILSTAGRDSVCSPALTLRGFCVMSSKLVDSRLSFMATYRCLPSSSGSRECRSPAARGRVSSRPFWISSRREEEEFVQMILFIFINYPHAQTSLIDLTFSFQCEETMKTHTNVHTDTLYLDDILDRWDDKRWDNQLTDYMFFLADYTVAHRKLCEYLTYVFQVFLRGLDLALACKAIGISIKAFGQHQAWFHTLAAVNSNKSLRWDETSSKITGWTWKNAQRQTHDFWKLHGTQQTKSMKSNSHRQKHIKRQRFLQKLCQLQLPQLTGHSETGSDA